MNKYTWFAEYFTDKIIYEQDPITQKTNNFADIKPSLLRNVGFISDKNKIQFNCDDGVFLINDDVYSFTFGYRNKMYDVEYRIENISLLKRAEADICLNEKHLEPIITGYYCGYTYELELKQKEILTFVPTICIEDELYFKLDVDCSRFKSPLVVNVMKNDKLFSSYVITEKSTIKFFI